LRSSVSGKQVTVKILSCQTIGIPSRSPDLNSSRIASWSCSLSERDKTGMNIGLRARDEFPMNLRMGDSLVRLNHVAQNCAVKEMFGFGHKRQN
jgi:hypothetical protein